MTNEIETPEIPKDLGEDLLKLKKEDIAAYHKSTFVMTGGPDFDPVPIVREVSLRRMIGFALEHNVFFDSMIDYPDCIMFKEMLKFILVDFRNPEGYVEIPKEIVLDIISEMESIVFYHHAKDESSPDMPEGRIVEYKAYSVPKLVEKIDEYLNIN